MTFHELLFGYVFYYPFLMAWVWMAGGFAHVLVFERRRHVQADPLTRLPPKSGLTEWPLVSVIVPCHNEAAQIEEVIAQLMKSRYPDFEVLAVNDGSSDDTGAILDRLALQWPRLRVVQLPAALQVGAAYGLTVRADAPAAAQAFASALRQPPAQAVLQRLGFGRP